VARAAGAASETAPLAARAAKSHAGMDVRRRVADAPGRGHDAALSEERFVLGRQKERRAAGDEARGERGDDAAALGRFPDSRQRAVESGETDPSRAVVQ